MEQALSAYLPMDRRQALARGDDLPDRTLGAALFADISGFTPLTEALVNDLGPQRGAEELTKQLNTIYTGLVAELHRYHGSVIAFSGDAITGWFEADSPASDGAGQASLRALACALAMQEVMRQFAALSTPSGATVSLAIKVAVTAGPARRFRVGDPAIQYMDALAGDTLVRLALTEHEANKGEVVASSEVIDMLGDGVRVSAWRATERSGLRVAVVAGLTRSLSVNPWPPLPANALLDEQVRPWLLQNIYERERAGQAEFLAELRPAAVLFLSFGGIDYDQDSDAGAKLDAFIRWAQHIVARDHDGALLQLTIGDKGSYFYAAFGAPVAHDDDSARAVSAALVLRAPSAELSYITRVQTGISQGRVWAGPYGGQDRRTYGVLGDDVNLSARLMSHAQPGQVLVSQRVAGSVQRHYRIESLAPIEVKGKRKLIQVAAIIDRHTPTTQRPATLYTQPLVGREVELARLAAMLETACNGAGQVLQMEGPAGVGKSHLCAELVERALARGVRVALGACQSTTQDTAYAPWRQVMRSFLNLSVELDTEAQIATVESFVSQTNRDWLLRLPLLGRDLLDLPIPENATTEAFEPKLRQSALFDLVVEVLRDLAAAQPLLIIVDDAHWMDEASLGLTLALSRAITDQSIFLVLVHHPPQSEQSLLPELAGLELHHRLVLDELSPAGVAALVTARLGGPPNPLALSLVQAETQGNPFFVEEVLDTLRETGNLHPHTDGQWRLSPRIFAALQQANYLMRSENFWVLAPHASLSAIDLGLPDSIQGVVLARIDRLPETDKLTLKVAGVVGRTFAFDLVSQAHPLRPDDGMLAEHLNRLETRDFTHLESPRPRLSYIFKHNVTRDVAYDTLLFDQRRQLHRAVGQALERLTSEATAQIAYHAYSGEDWERALRYNTLAGQQAQKLYANQEGIEHFRRALRSAEHLPADATLPQRQQIHASLGQLLTTTGQYDAAVEHLRQALTLAEALNDVEAQAKACRGIAYAYELQSEYATALTWIGLGLQALGQRETTATAELLAINGLIHTRQGNYELATEQCDRSIRIGEALGEPAPLAMAHNARGLVAFTLSDSASAIEHYQRAFGLYQQADNIHGQALSYNSIGNAYQSIGQWTKADQHLRRAREIFIQTGDVRWTAITNNNLGEIARHQGRLAEALAFYQDALQSLQRLGGSPYILGVLHMNLGATSVRRGEIVAARRHLDTSRENFARAHSRDYLAELQRHQAEAALAVGELAEAQTLSEQAVALARELTMRGEEGSSLQVLGQVAYAEGSFALAERHLTQSLSILQEVGHEHESARSQLWLAKVYLAQGKPQDSAAMLDKCLPVFERLDALLDLAEARHVGERLSHAC